VAVTVGHEVKVPVVGKKTDVASAPLVVGLLKKRTRFSLVSATYNPFPAVSKATPVAFIMAVAEQAVPPPKLKPRVAVVEEAGVNFITADEVVAAPKLATHRAPPPPL